MADTTVPTPPSPRQPHQDRPASRVLSRLTAHLADHAVDTAVAAVGTIALVVGCIAEPMSIAGPAIAAAALTGLTLTLRNTGCGE